MSWTLITGRPLAPRFKVLEDAIRACEAATGAVDESTLRERCLLAWSAVHGFATLCLEGAMVIDGRGAKTRLRRSLELGRSLLRLLGPSLFPSMFPSGAAKALG